MLVSDSTFVSHSMLESHSMLVSHSMLMEGLHNTRHASRLVEGGLQVCCRNGLGS